MNTNIKIIDDMKPEDLAMLQALYSRSPASVEDHLDKVRDKGSASFMGRYYVGYNHKSIGDCGTTTIFIEGVTMLCAKAIQDWPLYSGQEASTRYMDFSEASFANPLGTEVGKEIQEAWRAMYLKLLDPVRDDLRKRYPRQADEDEGVYERAIQARSFDILRSFLPAGATTNLSWTTNLRQAQDHLDWLFTHPDRHVADVAFRIYDGLKATYPHSFKVPTKAQAFRMQVMDRSYFLRPGDPEREIWDTEDVIFRPDFKQRNMDKEDVKLLQTRPRGAEVPWFLAEYGTLQSVFALDFGSFRDLQRHRNGTVRMPLLTTKLGFHPWYIQELPEDLRDDVRHFLNNQAQAINLLDCDDVTRQSYIAMGYLCRCRVTQPLPGFVYRLELRSGKTVHPTLRQVVLKEIEAFRKDFPDVALHVDEDPDSWTVRRGKQTITEKT